MRVVGPGALLPVGWFPPPAVLVALLARAPCARRGQRRPWNLAANVFRFVVADFKIGLAVPTMVCFGWF